MKPWRRRAAKPVTYRVSTRRVMERHNALRRELTDIRREDEAMAGRGQDSLTAAGQRVKNGQATLLRRLIQPWQIRSFGYYDTLGEIKFSAQFYSRALSNLRLYVAYREDNDDLTEVDRASSADAAEAVDALGRIRDPGGGGRSGLLAAYGRLMFLVGETYLFVSINPDTGLEQWEMLSTDEIRLNDGLYTRFKAPSLAATQFSPAPDDQFELVGVSPKATDEQRASSEAKGLEEAVAYRLWRRHPRFSDLADATMGGVLELCEELVLLTQAVRARARSRLAGSGVLFLDARITTTPVEPVPDEDPAEDPFIADLTDAMTAPIVDEGTASAVVPLVARVSVPDGMSLSDLVYHLQIIDPTQVYPETGLRMECIKRIAIGLDMPAEILLGLQDSNHWSAWQVDEQSWKAHLQPVAQQLVEDLTSAYLTPALKQAGIANWDRYVIAFDASAIINHPDRFKDAKEAYDRRAIGKEALRDAGGFDDDDAMPEDERAEAIGIAVRDANLAWEGEPTKTPAPEGGSEENEDEGEGAETGAEVEKGPPKSGPEALPETVLGAAVEVARIEGASYMALLRAREAAGARIRTAATSSQGRQRDPEAAAAIDGVPARDVASKLGAARVRVLLGGAHEAQAIAGARLLITDALEMVGVRANVVAAIADNVERHAVRTLYEPRATLNGSFGEYVRGLLSAQDGG